MHGKNFPLMLLPRLDGELIESYIKELDGAIAGGNDHLVLVGLRPREVVQRVLGVKPADAVSIRRYPEKQTSVVPYHFSTTMPFGVSPRI